MEKKESEYDNSIKAKESEIETLENGIKQKEEEIETLKNDYKEKETELHNKINQKETEIDSMKKINEELKNEYNELVVEYNILGENYAKLKSTQMYIGELRKQAFTNNTPSKDQERVSRLIQSSEIIETEQTKSQFKLIQKQLNFENDD